MNSKAESMESIRKSFAKTGIDIPEIMLPAEGTDLSKWSVIACDQYTSQPDYWSQVERIAGDGPSTYHITLPEIYLKSEGWADRIGAINSNMEKYLEEGKIKACQEGFILVDRSTPHAPSRKGLIMAVDLESYDYRQGSQSLIRATEGTVLDRIPPRVKIRENAPIELPHIMILIDDPDKTVIEPLFDRLENGQAYEKAYDFELMLGGGHIRGWKVKDEQSLGSIASALEKLASPPYFRSRYDVGEEKGILLFAVGDGNHSLASAKAHWENVKRCLKDGSVEEAGNENSPAGQIPAPVPEHPARYALVEVVNVHDSGIVFEPIHRVLFGIDAETVMDELKSIAESINKGSKVGYRLFGSKEEMEEEKKMAVSSGAQDPDSPFSSTVESRKHTIPFILEGAYGLLTFENPSCSLETGTLQSVLDVFVKKHSEAAENSNEGESVTNVSGISGKSNIEIDYIHGDRVVTELCSKKGCIGFYMPVMDKRDLFKAVILEGALPRKTFSMGEAEEKRYYLECRRIR